MKNMEECNNEASVLDCFNILNKRKTLIISIIAVSVIATGIISFLSPKIYKARAVIMPASQQAEPSGMSAIALQFGITSPPASNVAEIVALLKSNILMEKVIKKYDLTPLLTGKDTKGEKKEKTVWAGIRHLRNNIFKVNNNKMDGIIELSAEFRDPELSARILNYILTELTEYMSSEAKRVAETNKKYLEALINKNADPLIKQKIYSLIARQIEISMMAEVKENFAFKVLDPPRVPDRKIRPNIRGNIILAFTISLFAEISLAFFVEYIESIRKREAR